MPQDAVKNFKLQAVEKNNSWRSGPVRDVIYSKKVEDGYGCDFCQVTTDTNKVLSDYSRTEDVCVLELISGEKIYIALPINDLYARLNKNFGAVDLSDVTGESFPTEKRPNPQMHGVKGDLPFVEARPRPDLKIGDQVYNDEGVCTGIYIGAKERTDKYGLKQVFDLYAAPEDLTNKQGKKRLVATFNKSVEVLNQKENWHGYDGECFTHEAAFKQALIEGTYQGGWVIPSKDIILENLCKNKNKGALAGMFKEYDGLGLTDLSSSYWSCTHSASDLDQVYNLQIRTNQKDYNSKDHFRLSTRPIRAELRPS